MLYLFIFSIYNCIRASQRTMVKLNIIDNYLHSSYLQVIFVFLIVVPYNIMLPLRQ
jgi:hypothetical protein